MKILLIGSGAREHAIALHLSKTSEVFCIMPSVNPAIASLCKKYWVAPITDVHVLRPLIREAKSLGVTLGFASPDATLASGVSDLMASEGLLVASPSKAASRIEWDKVFMRSLMASHSIPGQVRNIKAHSREEALLAMESLSPCVIKPLGLTGGKGVQVQGEHFTTKEEGLVYANSLLTSDGICLIEEKLEGEEFSLQCFSDGTHVSFMPPVQDHKRAFIGDTGPNTGGMGTYSTGRLLPFMSQKDLDDSHEILRKILNSLKKEGTPFVGVLYGQFMATKDGIRVIEFNARFGDPEAMNVLSVLKTPLAFIFESMAQGALIPCEFEDQATVVKYVVPQGYPNNPQKDQKIHVGRTDAQLFFASIYEKNGQLYTGSSRTIGVLGKGNTAQDYQSAERIAEQGCQAISGAVWHREDIGTRQLIEKRVLHMRQIRG